jgi:hypothetical protein
LHLLIYLKGLPGLRYIVTRDRELDGELLDAVSDVPFLAVGRVLRHVDVNEPVAIAIAAPPWNKWR